MNSGDLKETFFQLIKTYRELKRKRDIAINAHSVVIKKHEEEMKEFLDKNAPIVKTKENCCSNCKSLNIHYCEYPNDCSCGFGDRYIGIETETDFLGCVLFEKDDE